MRTLGNAVVLAALLAVTACGTSTDDRSTGARPHGCTPRLLEKGTAVGVADLDGDHHADKAWFAPSGPCRGLASATGAGLIGTTLGGLDVDASTIRPVQLRGDDPQVLYLVGERPRAGGRQWHLYGSDGDALAEVERGGRPLLPFHATDGSGRPTTATCPARGGVAVVTATTHEPPGIVLAWDVSRTSYRVDGAKAVVERRATLAEAAADPTLRKRMPHLFDGTLFTGCDPRTTG